MVQVWAARALLHAGLLWILSGSLACPVTLCTCMLSSAGSLHLPSAHPSPLPSRLCQLLGFPSSKPPSPAGSDGRAPPDSIALIPFSLGPRLPSSAPSRGHSVHGRQSSAAEGSGLRARGYRWQVHPAEVHHQGAGLPSRLWRVGLRAGRQTASGAALQSRTGEVRGEEGKAEGDLLPLLREKGRARAAASLRLALGPLRQRQFKRSLSGWRGRARGPPGEAGRPGAAAQRGGEGRCSQRALLRPPQQECSRLPWTLECPGQTARHPEVLDLHSQPVEGPRFRSVWKQDRQTPPLSRLLFPLLSASWPTFKSSIFAFDLFLQDNYYTHHLKNNNKQTEQHRHC